MKTTLIQTVIFNTYYNYILTLPPDLPLSLMQVGCGNHGSEPIKEHKGILLDACKVFQVKMKRIENFY